MDRRMFVMRVGLLLVGAIAVFAGTLAVRGATPSAFERRCIPAGCVAPPSNIPDILSRRALPSGRLAVLDATMDLHHGLPGAGAEKRAIAPPGIKPIGPYSPGILAGDFLYVSGQGGRDADGKLPATIEGQARQTLQNVKSIVEAAGLTMEHVVYSPGVPGRHGAPRRDGPGLEGVLCQGAAGPRGARDLQAADGHRGRDQRRRVPRPRPARGPSSRSDIRRTCRGHRE